MTNTNAANTATIATVVNNDDTSPPPPSYAPVDGIQPATSSSPSNATAVNPNEIPFKPYVDGISSLPSLNDNNGDVESGSKPRKKWKNKFLWHRRLHSATKERFGGAVALIAVIAAILLLLAVVGGIVFGFSVATERGLTGEDFWSPNHNSLFRICESDSTSSKPFQLHTCNVFRPNYDLEAAPLHSFVETVRQWSTGAGSKLDGQARRIDAVRLDALLLTYGLKCSIPPGVTLPPKGSQGRDAQLIIGGVGTGFDRKKHATACNYWQDGSLKQDSCARYNDGGVKTIGKTHPLGINAIMRKHFDMTCEWVA